MSELPLILFVPGLRPKPEPERHKAELLRCLAEGVRRTDSAVAADLQAHAGCLEVIAWTFPFYGVHHDIELDLPGIDALIETKGASPRDRADAESWALRVMRSLYRFADRLPFQVPPIGNETLELHLKDLRRYVRNKSGVADTTRELLQAPLVAAARRGRPTLLIGHSMGSVIAFDTLWQLSHESDDAFRLDMLLTLGSPLGQNLIRRQLLGHERQRGDRYPRNIRRWINISAVGDMTAFEPEVAEHFSEMIRLQLIDSIEDYTTYNYFRHHGQGGQLNVHSEYGYLANELTAGIIAKWWAAKRAASSG
jgi:pimeloyl-ACP methyl ester carboxylesterase